MRLFLFFVTVTVEVTLASVPFFRSPRCEGEGRGVVGGSPSLLHRHLFQGHCPMAASLICPITGEDYDVLCFLPTGSPATSDSRIR